MRRSRSRRSRSRRSVAPASRHWPMAGRRSRFPEVKMANNHPNRSGHGAGRNPGREEILALLALAGLTPDQGAALIHVTPHNMQKWTAEKPEGRMHPAFWRLLKVEIVLR